MIPTWAIKSGAVVALVISLIFGYNAWANHQQTIGEARAMAKYDKLLDKQKLAASTTLAKETAKVTALSGQFQDLKNKQEIKDATNRKINDELASRVRSLTDSLGRLHDPNGGVRSGPGGNSTKTPNSTGTGDCSGDTGETTGILSTQLSGLLQRLTGEADQINLAYISCRADSFNLRSIMIPTNGTPLIFGQ